MTILPGAVFDKVEASADSGDAMVIDRLSGTRPG